MDVHIMDRKVPSMPTCGLLHQFMYESLPLILILVFDIILLCCSAYFLGQIFHVRQTTGREQALLLRVLKVFGKYGIFSLLRSVTLLLICYLSIWPHQ